VIDALSDAFNTRELVKVTFWGVLPIAPREAADEIVRRLAEVQIAQVIGRTIVAYRPFPEDPAIQLPR
jgi:RNA-binding protein